MDHAFQAALLLLFAIFAVPATPVAAQSPISAEPSCDVCSIGFRADVELLHQESPAYLRGPTEILPLHNGQFATSVLEGGQSVSVAIFDAGGAFVREIGQQGEGPMEIDASPRLAMPTEEGFLAHDPRLGRLSFMSHGGRVEWQERMDAISFQMIQSGENMAISGVSTVDGVPYGIGLFSARGEHIRSVLPLEQQQSRMINFPVLAGTESGAFWAIPRHGGALTLFSDEGEVVEKYSVPLQVPPAGFQMPVVFGLQAQEDHLFIIQILPFDDDADPAVARRTPGMIGSKVTVFDPARREIVAVEWLEGMVFPMGFGMFSQQIPDALGDARIWIGTLVLDRSG